MLLRASEIPATYRFDRETTYTFRRGPNAGRALKYIGPGEYPIAEFVRVVTADGQPFEAKSGRHEGRVEAVCLPADLVVK